jgi:hypothetical protein
MGGTLWYHAHVHTTTEAQVGAGAFGMLIIEDDNAALGVPDSGVEEFLARENEIIMAMGFVNNVQTANGAPLANVNVVAGHWYRMRLLRMDPQGTPRPFAIGVGCEAYMVSTLAACCFLLSLLKSRLPSLTILSTHIICVADCPGWRLLQHHIDRYRPQ